MVQFMSCNTDTRAGVYEDASVQLLTLSSEKKSSSWVTEEGHYPINLLSGGGGGGELMCIHCQQHSMLTTFSLPLCLANNAITNQSQLCVFKNQPQITKFCCRPFKGLLVVGAICTPSE